MSKPTIHLAKDLDIPFNVTTAKISFMGGNGSGKTYCSSKMVEEILRASGWVIIFDPVGIHYGLRLDESGKKPSGLDIPIFGGHHADVILTPESGTMIADLLCDRRLSAILDVSEFTDPELNRFATDFGIQFEKRMKDKHRAVTLVLEECQEFIPQNPMKGEERKLHIWNRITKIGRNYGIGVMMISARPQDINKKSLNLTQLMFAFQMTGTHERKAMQEWFTYSKFDAKIGDILPSLEVGEPYVMSPRMLKINKKIKILPKTTFDASATPDFFADDSKTIALKPIDISALETAMKNQISQAKENDPKELKARIKSLEVQKTQLEHQLATRPKDIQHVAGKQTIKTVIQKVPVFNKNEVQILKSLDASLRGLHKDLLKDVMNMGGHLELLNKALVIAQELNVPIPKPATIFSQPATPIRPYTPTIPLAAKKQAIPAISRPTPTETPSERLDGPEQRILDALATFRSIHHDMPLRSAVAFLAGYSANKSFINPCGRLKGKGYIEYNGDRLSITPAGLALASAAAEPLTSQELIDKVISLLPGPERKILIALLPLVGYSASNMIDRATLASASGYELTKSFINPLGRLRSLGLIEYHTRDQTDYIKAAGFLFLEE